MPPQVQEPTPCSSTVLVAIRLGLLGWLAASALSACESAANRPARPGVEAGAGEVRGPNQDTTLAKADGADGPADTADEEASTAADAASPPEGDATDGPRGVLPASDDGTDAGLDARDASRDDLDQDGGPVLLDLGSSDHGDVVEADATAVAGDAADGRDATSAPGDGPDGGAVPDVPLAPADGANARPEAPRDGAVERDGRSDVADASDTSRSETLAIDGDVDGGGACCGCLCRDPTWSCAKDTCLDTAGRALTLAAEAGFFELAGGSYVAEGQPRSSPGHRIWYSFHPAAAAPESKPLAVFWNGGPGSATSAFLFAFNTAPTTLDPAFTGSATIASNASSWTQLANLLYIDAPATGFSYPLALASGDRPSVGIDIDRDAALVLRVIVRFLDRHPALQSNRVLIVGESYGGTRATLLLAQLFNYTTLISSSAAYRDADLYDDLVRHFGVVFPGEDPRQVPAAKLAAQFGHQILIEPVVAGDAQWSRNQPDKSVCVTGYDIYQCDQPAQWSDQLAQQAATNLTRLVTLRQALGVDPVTIEWLYARARGRAYGRAAGTTVSTPEMVAAFGTLAAGDNYFLILNTDVLAGRSGARTWHDPMIGVSFLHNLVYVDTFITSAKLDMAVWTPAIAPALASYTSLVASATLDSAPRAGVARPGWIAVSYVPGAIPDATTREIRFPFYAAAGHMVSIREPAHLLADVRQWMDGTLAAATPAAPAVATASPVPLESPVAASVWSTPQLFIGP
jgi:hypothetical protein